MAISTEYQSGLLTIQIDRPERKNAFTNSMYTALGDAFAQAMHNDAIKVVLIKGHVGAFSAGNDLSDFVNAPPKDHRAPVFRFLRLINTFPKPVVAQVEGVAVGIGTTMLLHCDLVYAADNARFSMPFTQLGLCPEAASSLLLPALAGYQKAAELLLLGEMFDAAKACECGIVTDVLPADAVAEHVQNKVATLLRLPMASLLATKKLMKGHMKEQVANTLNDEGVQFVAMIPREDAQEAFAAFAEKRKPNFRR